MGTTIDKRGLSDVVYQTIKQQILDQQIVPGARVNIGTQARILGVSPTPVREALNRLAAEKLVVSEHYSGYRVSPAITAEYLGDLFDYRMLLEGHCASIGAPRRDKRIIAGLSAAYRKMAKFERIGSRFEEYRQFIASDHAFHELIVESAGNKVMLEQYRALNAISLQSRVYLHRSGGTHSTEVIREHKAILDAFEAGDGEAAKEAIRAHLDGGRRRLLGLSNAGK